MIVNYVQNGDFLTDLNSWTANGTAARNAAEGHVIRGSVLLAASGDFISQTVNLPRASEYYFEIWGKFETDGAALTITILDNDGQTVFTSSPTLSSVWEDSVGVRVGLAAGSYELKILFATQAAYIDRVSLAVVHATRLELAEMAAGRLGQLATADAGYTTIPEGTQTEGDYTQAVTAALRTMGATDGSGRVDIRYLDPGFIEAAVGEIEAYMLNRLHMYYSQVTDYTLGPRTERKSQIAGTIERRLGLAVGGRSATVGRGVQQRPLRHKGRPT